MKKQSISSTDYDRFALYLEALSRFPEKSVQIGRCRFVQGETFQEIALRYGITKQTVRKTSLRIAERYAAYLEAKKGKTRADNKPKIGV